MAARYFLIADPNTGLVLKRTHAPSFCGVHIGAEQLEVTKTVWKTYEAGDLVQIGDLSGWDLEKWVRSVNTRA